MAPFSSLSCHLQKLRFSAEERSPRDLDAQTLEVVGHQLSAPSQPESEPDVASDQELLRIERTAEDSLMLGVSVAYLASGFLEELDLCFGAGADPNYHEINEFLLYGPSSRGAAFYCPRDGLAGCSYVDGLAADHTGPATVMLSWCWSYRARIVVSSLERWCERSGRDPAHTFVWQCALCCNQFRVEEKKARGEWEPFEVFEAEFESRVRATMHVLALLDTWDNPLYIGRIWCIFELWKAMETDGCVLDVILPELEELRFKDSLRTDGLQSMWKAFERLRIQDAQASVEADRLNILRLVDPDAQSADELDVSERCAALNREVRQRLQGWCVDTAAAHAESQVSDGCWLGQTGLFAGNLLMGAANFERAEAILSAARASMESVGAADTHDYFVLLRHCAELENNLGRHEEAAELMGRVLMGFEGDATSSLPERLCAVVARRFEFPKALRVAGETANLQGRLASAVELFRRARAAYEVVGADGEHGYTRLLIMLATCLCRQGRHDEAEEVLTASAAAADGDDCRTPEDGEVRKALGWCRMGQGRHEDALECFTNAHQILEDTGATTSVSYGNLLLLLGSCQLELESPREAQAFFDQASIVFEDIGATGRLEYQALPFFYGRLHLLEGRPAAAMELFEEAREVIEAADAVETPEYGRLLLAMGKCQLQQGCSSRAVDFFNDAKAAFDAGGAADAFAHLMLLGA